MFFNERLLCVLLFLSSLFINHCSFFLGRTGIAAIECRLRGADAIYVTVSELYSTQLISLDKEMLERGKQIVTTITPDNFGKILS